MPLLEFKCECGRTFELRYRMSESEAVVGSECESCGKLAKRVLSVTGSPQFNGSGFYATDYKNR